MIIEQLSAISYNQPKFDSYDTWSANAITFATSAVVGYGPFGIFIDINDTIYIADNTNNRVQIWLKNSANPIRTISGGLASPFSLFITDNGDIYVDNGNVNYRVDKWSLNSSTSVPVMYVNSGCRGLFIDINNTLYCSLHSLHQVIKKSLNNISNVTICVAGTGTSGSAANMLTQPYNIFVDLNFNLYVADFGNNRIQLFQLGQSNGITVAGNTSVNTTITLSHPSGIALDADHYLFIVDQYNQRIVASSQNGFRCLVGCYGQIGSASNQLYYPMNLAFDTYGNIYVTDYANNRIQKFILLNNSYGKTTSFINQITSTATTAVTTEIPTSSAIDSITSTAMRVTSSNINMNGTCFPPKVTVIPGSSSSLSIPIEFRRSQSFSISSLIEINCNDTLSMNTKWTIKSCNLINCSYSIELDPTIVTTFSEIYIAARTLPYGTYEFKLTVNMVNFSNTTTRFSSIYIRIISSNIIVNLVQLGTSMITNGNEQDLQIDPGQYSIDPDENMFNISNWNYQYYCRIYDEYQFSILNYSLNSSCLSDGKGRRFDNLFNSSLTILAGTLQINQTYQVLVRLTNYQNSSIQFIGYLIVNIEQSISLPTIFIGCVISSMCISNNIEYQYVNPTTQLSLYSICNQNCQLNQYNITWNIYYATQNLSVNSTTWVLFQQTNLYEDIYIFGRNASNITVLKEFFSENFQKTIWKFEVVYQFESEISISSLNFLLNQPPSNGSCSINPLNGTTTTLFHITCFNWFDSNGIKDYTLYVWKNDSLERQMIAFSMISTFDVYLPIGDNETSLINLVIDIQDEFNCLIEVNISSVNVISDGILIDNITENPMNKLLSSENQNLIAQIIISICEELNQMNKNSFIDLSVSSLDTKSQSEILVNQSMLNAYIKQLNSHSILREYLIQFLIQFPIITLNNIKLQSSILSQLTQKTNELTRMTLEIISNRCYQLASMLNTMKTEVSYEDVQFISANLLQCSSNLLTSVNGPLQGRTRVLDIDFTRATTFPVDYDTNLDFDWANLNLFSDGNDFSWETIEKNRNLYYQKQLSNQITNQMNKLLRLLTSTLVIHLNIEQTFQIKTSQIYMSLESIIEPLAPFGNSTLLFNTNYSRLVSFTLLDQNFNEISIKSMRNQSIQIIIPRDQNLIIPPMIFQNVTSMNLTFHYHYLNISSLISISIHWQIQPLNETIAYLFLYKFDGIPQINQIDGWTIFCPKNLLNNNIYEYFIDNQQTLNHQYLIFALQELNSTEIIERCSNSSTFIDPPIRDKPFQFTSNYQFRVYTSSCYYLDENNQWKTDGLIVGSLTNLNQTECYSNHLTSFSGAFSIYLTPIDWKYGSTNNDDLTKNININSRCYYENDHGKIERNFIIGKSI
ncbi:unnamed protein product [Adineta ricciae]|uniref:PKD/REJ-like domain-containing protein n=1 Tax=Adineta ricciae TaxID=249248 RepID=A0A815TS78_ADIRI|nr:unnamed protein product [Adineta ricciae]